jgi:hypothetical protein
MRKKRLSDWAAFLTDSSFPGPVYQNLGRSLSSSVKSKDRDILSPILSGQQ